MCFPGFRIGRMVVRGLEARMDEKKKELILAMVHAMRLVLEFDSEEWARLDLCTRTNINNTAMQLDTLRTVLEAE